MNKPDIKPYSAREEKFGTALIKTVGAIQVFVYRLTGGRLMKKFLGAPVAILTTTGRKSGAIRRTPLLFLEDGEKVVLAASKGGMSGHPMWKYNLDANASCEIQIGPVNRDMTARQASSDEEEHYWPQLTEIYEDFNEYRARTDGVRHINLYILEPR
jgi:deazaflavin-dependent oxidoreductase (nitroreductase family)